VAPTEACSSSGRWFLYVARFVHLTALNEPALAPARDDRAVQRLGPVEAY
jgi:hypothetical protein